MPEPTQTTRYVEGKKLSELWNKHDKATERERLAIERTRKLIQHELRAIHSDEMVAAGAADDFAVSLASASVVPMQTNARVGKQRPIIKRPRKAVGSAGDTRATRIELPVNAVMDLLYPWWLTVDIAVNESPVCVITQLEPTHWARRPTRYEVDPRTGEQDKKKVRDDYQVDAEGRTKSHSYYRRDPKRKDGYQFNGEKSANLYQEDLNEWLANNPPIVIRAFSRRECAPVNPRWEGDRLLVDGVIIKKKYTVSDLISRKSMRWGGCDRLMQADPSGEITVYEGWLNAANGDPYVSYHVDGADKPAEFEMADKSRRPAIINLRDEWDIDELPVAYRYGLCFPGAAPGYMGMPLMKPHESALLLEDKMASAKVAHAENYAFPGWFFIRKEGTPNAAARIDGDGNPLPTEVPPNSIVYLPPGEMIPSAHPGTNHDVQELIALTRAEIADAKGTEASPDAAGYAQLIQRSGQAESIGQIYACVWGLYEDTAQHALRAMCAWAKKRQLPFLIAHNSDVINPSDDDEGSEIIELDPEIVRGNYRLKAIVKKEFGENPVATQQRAEIVDKKIMPLRWMLEEEGVESPEQVVAEVAVEGIMSGELGQREILAVAQQITQDKKLKELLTLIKNQEVIPENGDPIAAVQAGLEGPEGGHMTGLGGAQLAQNALSGTIGGGMQAGAQGNAVAQGVVNPMPGGV